MRRQKPSFGDFQTADLVGGAWVVRDMNAEELAAARPTRPLRDPKITGVLFNSVMCSATEADQNGLSAVLMAIQFQGAEFPPTRFYFANGNTLVITLANYQEFASVWLPFRQSFFRP